MCTDSCFDCNNCFSSDLFDGEYQCKITGEWFDLRTPVYKQGETEECHNYDDSDYGSTE